MSAIYFTSPDREIWVRGSERANLSGLVNDVTEGLLHLRDSTHVDRLASLVSPSHYMAKHPRTGPGMTWPMAYCLSMAHGSELDGNLIEYRGRRIDEFMVSLNSALVIGSDPLRLAARLHAQCELHAWVSGPDRAWLAGVIEDGLESGIFRHGLFREDSEFPSRQVWDAVGWDRVIDLLREDDSSPVVTSNSSGDGFPEKPTGFKGSWSSLDYSRRWTVAIEERGLGLRLNPDGWKTYRFGHRLSALDLTAPDFEDRIRTALGSGVTA